MVVDSETDVVRYIFRRYAALGSVRLLQEELSCLHLSNQTANRVLVISKARGEVQPHQGA